jgi:hypothetical protein
MHLAPGKIPGRRKLHPSGYPPPEHRPIKAEIMKNFLMYLSGVLIAAIACLGLLVYLPLKPPPTVGVSADYVISQVSVVDTVTGDILPNQHVIIANGRIIDIKLATEAAPATHLVDIPAAGKYLIPGLWDMHTHGLKLSPQLHHPLFIRWGVTSVRDMSGCMARDDSYWACPADRREWERQALTGAGVSPRYPLQSSYQTNGGNEVPTGYPAFFRLRNAADAAQLVDFYAGQGVDFIKTYSELAPEQFRQLARAATVKNIALAGHKPLSISLREALDVKLQSIEHGRLFAFECFKGIGHFRQLEDPISHYTPDFIRELIGGQDEERCALLMKSMASSSSSWVPTLTTLKMGATARDAYLREDPRLEAIPYVVRQLIWNPDIARAADSGFDTQGRFVHAEFFELATRQVGEAHDAGIRLLAGTDNIDSWVFSGSSLHDELAMLVEAGLTPLAALQTATTNAAQFSQLGDQLGAIAVGRDADLVLLNSNPLTNIENTRDIHGVMLAGHYFDREDLDELETYANDMAGSFRVNLRYLYDMIASPTMRAQLAD